MTRPLIPLVLLAALATRAAGQECSLEVVSIDGDHLILHSRATVVQVVRYQQMQREIVANGVKRTVTELVPVTAHETRPQTQPLKEVTVFDLDGLKVDPARLPAMFKRPRAALLSYTGKVPKEVREALKDGTLVVVLPEPRNPPPR